MSDHCCHPQCSIGRFQRGKPLNASRAISDHRALSHRRALRRGCRTSARTTPILSSNQFPLPPNSVFHRTGTHPPVSTSIPSNTGKPSSSCFFSLLPSLAEMTHQVQGRVDRRIGSTQLIAPVLRPKLIDCPFSIRPPSGMISIDVEEWNGRFTFDSGPTACAVEPEATISQARFSCHDLVPN